MQPLVGENVHNNNNTNVRGEDGDLRTYLNDYVHKSGAAAELKARLKTILMSRLLSDKESITSPSDQSQKSLFVRAVNTFIMEHLNSIGFECTANVFSAESSTSSSSTLLTVPEACEVFQVPDHLSANVTDLMTLITTLQRCAKIGLHVSDCYVQATPNEAAMTLEEKLSMVEMEYNMKNKNGDDGNGSSSSSVWERRLRQREAELESLIRAEAHDQMELWRRRELEIMRHEEHKKYRSTIEEKLRECGEVEQRMKHALNLEKYEIEQRKRELEAKASEVESERTRLSSLISDRERSATLLHAELLETRDKLRTATTQLALLQEQLRDVSTQLETSQRRSSEREAELLRVRSEKERSELQHDARMSEMQRLVESQREELSQRALDIEHRLQNEQIRIQKDSQSMREQYENDDAALRRRAETLAKREEVLKKAVQDAQRAIQMSMTSNQYQQQQQQDYIYASAAYNTMSPMSVGGFIPSNVTSPSATPNVSRTAASAKIPQQLHIIEDKEDETTSLKTPPRMIPSAATLQTGPPLSAQRPSSTAKKREQRVPLNLEDDDDDDKRDRTSALLITTLMEEESSKRDDIEMSGFSKGLRDLKMKEVDERGDVEATAEKKGKAAQQKQKEQFDALQGELIANESSNRSSIESDSNSLFLDTIVKRFFSGALTLLSEKESTHRLYIAQEESDWFGETQQDEFDSRDNIIKAQKAKEEQEEEKKKQAALAEENPLLAELMRIQAEAKNQKTQPEHKTTTTSSPMLEQPIPSSTSPKVSKKPASSYFGTISESSYSSSSDSIRLVKKKDDDNDDDSDGGF
eukprot:PhM_4_TR15712/c1_g1_i6/m.28687